VGSGSILILVLIFAAVVGLFVVIGFLTTKSSSRLSGQWPGGHGSAVTQESVLLSKKEKKEFREVFAERVLKPLSGVMKVAGGSQSQLQEMLVHAGVRKKGAMEIFLGAKLALALALPAAVAAFFVWRASASGQPLDQKYMIIFCSCALGAGLMLPNFWLRRKANARKLKIRLALPDALDLLVVCVESGLGLDAAIVRIAQEMHESGPELSEELTLLNLEISAGKPREECFRNFGLRTGTEEAKSLAARINQASRFGTNLADSLRIHSESLRQKRRQQAEEAAAKTTVKLLFPLVFFVFPAIFVVILGPAAIRVLKTLK